MVIPFDYRMVDSMVCPMAGLVHGFHVGTIRSGIDHFYRPWFLHLWAGQKRTIQLAEPSHLWVCDLTSPNGSPWAAGTIYTSFI